jgi:tetratricopeptide (TPR) repeat protein
MQRQAAIASAPRHPMSAALFAAAFLALASNVLAQQPADAFREAQNAFFQNDYKRAGEKAAEHMTARNIDPSSAVGLECRFYIGMGDYFSGNFEKAITGLRAGLELRQLQNLRQIAAFYFADAYLRHGENLAKEEDEEKRAKAKEMFTAAESAFTNYLNDYKDGWLRSDAFVGLAKTYANLARFPEAIRMLNALIQSLTKPNPDPQEIAKIVESYTLKGSISKRYRDALIAEGKRDEAQQFMQDFKLDLENLLRGQTSPSVFNDVAFLLGDVLVTTQAYSDAIEFYRRIKTKEEVRESAQRILDEERARYQRARASAGGDINRLRELDTQWRPYLQRLQDRVKDLNSPDKPDPLVTAFTQVAYCYVALKRHHEAVIISHRLVPLSRGEDRKKSLKAAIFAAIGAKLPDDAAKLLAAFEAEFKTGDSDLQEIAFFIGQFYELSGEREKAREFYEKSFRDYPQGKHVTPTLLRLAIVNFHAEKYQEAVQQFDAYVKAIGELSDQYFYYRGKSLLALGRWLEAAEMFRDCLNLYPAFALKEDAVYCLGVALANGGKLDQAAEELQKYIDDPASAQSPNRPNFMLQLGLIYQRANKTKQAIETFKRLSEIQGTPLAVFAQLEIAKTLPKSEREKALRELVNPQTPPQVLVEVHYTLALDYYKDSKWKEAAEEFAAVVNKFPDDRRAADAQTYIAAGEFAPIRGVKKPGGLVGADLVNWESHVRRTMDAYEKLLARFPNSPHCNGALTFFTQIQLTRINEKIATIADVEKLFRDMAQRLASNPTTRARVLVALANVHSQLRPPDLVATLNIYGEAFKLSKDALGTLDNYNRYISLLLDAGDYDTATQLTQQLEQERFADGKEQQAAPFEAAWWTGRQHFLKKEYEKAKEQFEKLNDAPWAPHYPDAQFGLASITEALAAKPEDLDKALEMFIKIGRSPGTTAVRAQAMLRVGHIYRKQSDTAKPPQDAQLREEARKTFMQLVILYERERDACAEALYWAGQLHEADRKRPEAIRSYQQSVKMSPDGEYGLKSRKRLEELGVQPAAAVQP